MTIHNLFIQSITGGYINSAAINNSTCHSEYTCTISEGYLVENCSIRENAYDQL